MKTKTHNGSAVRPPKGGPQHVLLVESDKTAREYLGRILEVGGYRVTGVESSVVALQFLLGAPIDLVITDLVKHGREGGDLIEQMAEHFPKIPVIVMTRSKTATAQLSGRRTPNIKKFLHKPVSLDAFVSGVIEVFAKPQK